MPNITKYKKTILYYFISIICWGCKKSVEIPPPVSTITVSQVFSTDEQALSAATGMYFNLIDTYQGFASATISVFGGTSADELEFFDQTIPNYSQFQKNNLSSTNTFLANNFWGNIYSVIYSANSVIEGLSEYSGVHDSVKNELIGEAEFIRAFCNFYLVNLFGDIPLVTTTNYNKTSLSKRAPSNDVYTAIINDLKDAQRRLPSDYSAGNNQRIIPNKWAATALLARTYLYTKDWPNAEIQSSEIINNSSLYVLSKDLNTVFLSNSSEAIWQLQQNNEGAIPSLSSTPEGFLFIPRDSSYKPFCFITSQLLNAFETNDIRKSAWIKTTSYYGQAYSYPYKYKDGPLQAMTGGPYSEYSMVLRLAEQLLIRAEARAQQSNIGDAISDLNTIRDRAGLSGTNAVTKEDIIQAIIKERQVELFAEWGNRWLDLKRTGQANTILKQVLYKQPWSDNSLLYPIPILDLQSDPNLTQNPGY